ncbi:histidine kinase [Mariniluteicoccus endophyticus]
MTLSDRRLRTWSHRIVTFLVNVVVWVVALFASTLVMMETPWFIASRDPVTNQTIGNTLAMACWFLAILLSLSVFVRRRHPWWVLGTGLVIAVVLQLDAVVLLVGMAQLVAHGSARERTRAIALGASGSLFVLARLVWFRIPISGIAERGVTIALVHTLVMATAFVAALALGWHRRSRTQIAEADARVEKVEQRAEDLGVQVAQQAERERLAREIHDALAHRLSLVSLHSGALEDAARSGDPNVSEAAQVVRDNAHRSLEDLRDLIGALRNPQPAGPVEEPVQIPRYGMADVADVIDSTMAAGVQVNAFVMLCDPQDAGELLNRAVFRLVQEALTNVVKHAPGSRVGLDLRATPQDGVSLTVRNPLTGGEPMAPGSGSGLIGMRERVGALDGQFSAGPTDDGWFEVSVRLPWRHEDAVTA